MTAKYQLYRDNAGKFRFRLVAENKRTVVAGQSYGTRATCINGIESVRKNCGSSIEDATTAEVTKISFPKYQIFIDKAGEYRFNLFASNGEVIASSEGYSSKKGCLNGIASVQRIGNSEIEDLTIAEKSEEETDVSEKITREPTPIEPQVVEEKIEMALPVAETPATLQPEPTPELSSIPQSSDEKIGIKPPSAISKTAIAIAIIVALVGILLLALGGLVNLGTTLGTSDVTARAILMLTGEIVLGVAVLFYAYKK